MNDNKETVEIALLKLYGGEMIIGEIAVSDISEYVIANPRIVAMVPTMTGDVRVMMASVCEPFKVERLRKRIDIPRTNVMYIIHESELEKELIDGYKSEVSGIKIASADEIASVTSNKNSGDFIL